MPFFKISCSEAESFNNIFKTLGAVTKLFKLRIIQGHEHLPGYAVLVNGVEYAETNIVGRVSEVGYDWCKVTCIIDSSSIVPILVERTRDNCMAHGLLEGTRGDASMELYYLPSDRTNLEPGDIVVTSGIDGIYPKGILVGTVTEVFVEGEINAVISPSVDFMHLEEVAVILGEKADG